MAKSRTSARGKGRAGAITNPGRNDKVTQGRGPGGKIGPKMTGKFAPGGGRVGSKQMNAGKEGKSGITFDKNKKIDGRTKAGKTAKAVKRMGRGG